MEIDGCLANAPCADRPERVSRGYKHFAPLHGRRSVSFHRKPGGKEGIDKMQMELGPFFETEKNHPASLLALDKQFYTTVADKLGCHPKTVSKYIRAFLNQNMGIIKQVKVLAGRRGEGIRMQS